MNFRPKLDFTKHQLQNYLVKYKNKNSQKKQNFTQKAHTQLQNYLGIGLPKIIESLIICMRLMEYFLITSHQEEVKLLLLEKLQ